MSKRIQIILQDATVSVLDRVTTKGTRSRFIDQAVRRFAESQGNKSLREQLKAAYEANAGRDLAIAAEWLPLEEEAMRRSEDSRTPRKPGRSKRT